MHPFTNLLLNLAHLIDHIRVQYKAIENQVHISNV